MVASASPPSARARLIVVDEHAAVAEMVGGFARTSAGCEPAGWAGDAAAALELCRREQPDLVVLELMLPAGAGHGSTAAGLALLPALKASCARARVLVFSGRLRPAWIRRLLAAGADGLVEKAAPAEEFGRALRALAAGQCFYSRFASEQIRLLVNRDAARRAGLLALTEREREVLGALADGLSSKEIAARHGVSVHTVANHRSRLMRKTGRRGAAQLARFAVECGLAEDRVLLEEP